MIGWSKSAVILALVQVDGPQAVLGGGPPLAMAARWASSLGCRVHMLPPLVP